MLKILFLVTPFFIMSCGFKAPPTPFFPPYSTAIDKEVKSRKKDQDTTKPDQDSVHANSK